MRGLSVPLISFPQLFPGLGVEPVGFFSRGIGAVRGIFSFTMALYLLAVIYPESEFPLVQKLSTYAYVIFATVVSYQSRSGQQRHAAAARHLAGFTVFTLGNAAYSAFVAHQLLSAIFWAAWLPGNYVDRAIALRRTGNPAGLLVFSGAVLAATVAGSCWMLLERPAALDLLLLIPVVHAGSISLLYLGTSAEEYLSKRLARSRNSVGRAREIAERKLIAERAATQLQLDRINRSLTMGALAASIAHEISQPLAAVVTNASAAARWLREDNVDLAEARQAIGRVVEGGDRASAVINSFRTMLSGAEPQRSPVQLHELVREALNIRAPEIHKASITVLTPTLEAIPGVYGDGVQLRQVFLNLITNAIDAVAEVIDRPRLLIIHCEEDGDMSAVVDVEDNGPGLTIKGQKIFEPFFSTKSEGMGMGLFISRKIVESHGGSLRVQSRPGRTTFYVSLPIRRGS